MSETKKHSSKSGYQPSDPIDPPPLYIWPPNLKALVKWLCIDLLFPWGFGFIGLAFISWYFFTPSLETMSALNLSWISLIWLRNAALLILVAGSLHWLLYIKKQQDVSYKFDSRWPAKEDDRFLWGNQVWDNMFWSLVSGVTIWTLFESLTWWFYASGRVPLLAIREYPIYFSLMLISVFFWSTTHFYFVHRLLHWKPVYDLAHELHHRNVNVGPWSGISMHPLEHLIYFSVFVLWWFVPVHPVIILATGFIQGVSPAVSHSGFDQVILKGRFKISTGDYYHQLHHKFFHINYGNTVTPFDKLFNSWYDGTEAGRALIKQRMRKLRT